MYKKFGVFFICLCCVLVGVMFVCKIYDGNQAMIKTIVIKDLPINTLYSHRGLNSFNATIGLLEGENSVPSFILAGKKGYKYLETDIYETKDGKFYCIHDNETGTYSDTNITITDSLSSDVDGVLLNKIIKNANVDDKFKTRAYKIPSLNTYLEICKQYKMVPVIEIKKLQNYTTSVDNVIKIVQEYTDTFIIISFELSYVLRAKQYNKNILALYLTPKDNEITKDVVDFYTSNDIGLAVPMDKIKQDVCEYAFDKGYPVIVWSIDDKKQYLEKYKNWKVWMFGTNSIVL